MFLCRSEGAADMELCDGCHDKRVAAASESERGCAQTPVSVSHLVAVQSLRADEGCQWRAK